MICDAHRYIADMLDGVDVRYYLGDDHRLVGTPCPDMKLTPERPDPDAVTAMARSADLLSEGRGLLLDLVDRAEVRDAAAAWTGRVDTVIARNRSEHRFNSRPRFARYEGGVQTSDVTRMQEASDGSRRSTVRGSAGRQVGRPVGALVGDRLMAGAGGGHGAAERKVELGHHRQRRGHPAGQCRVHQGGGAGRQSPRR
ncbi:hypothetical protein ABT142_18465 [Streptomyces sp. NPDC001857]|uniref:aromatic-ring hydroxylase C-terminal domain-containing protein n=2 Tax=unclassified Streptomyces TaxID=2593676 RepID=UPI003322E736